MDLQQEVRILDNLSLFVSRTRLTGEEVPAFAEAMEYLKHRRERIAALAAGNGPGTEVPPADPPEEQ